MPLIWQWVRIPVWVPAPNSNGNEGGGGHGDTGPGPGDTGPGPGDTGPGSGRMPGGTSANLPGPLRLPRGNFMPPGRVQYVPPW